MAGYKLFLSHAFTAALVSFFGSTVFADTEPLTSPVAPAPRPAPVASPAQMRAEAELAESEGKWETALDLYLRSSTTTRPSPDVRDRIRVCLRNIAQLRRHRDPVFQQFVLTLPVSDALHLYAEVVGKLATLYSDRDRASPGRIFALGLDEFDRALSDTDFRRRHLTTPADPRVQKYQHALRDAWRQRLPSTAAEARHAARELVRDAQTQIGLRDPSAAVFELLCGACSGLDEFTVYVSPFGSHGDLALPVVELAEYGVLIRPEGSELVVDGIVPGSWAALQTTLNKGDRIGRVNGHPVDARNPAALAQSFRSQSGAGHELEVQYGDSRSPTTVQRLPVPLPTVYGAAVVNPKDGIGYLRLAGFRESTPREMDDALQLMKDAGVRALVIDARGNPGGSFSAAVQVAQRFLSGGIVVTTQGQSPEFANRIFSSDSGMNAYDIPVVLLIDTKTMSAAEALAAAWKDNNRATLVGLPTFGKGVVQSQVVLRAADGTDGSPRSGTIVMTVASMFAPRGGAINGVGVVPHVLEADPGRQLEQAIAKAVELANGMR
ncbi:S41 family peptidase [Fimbriiglobus ruber]|uniref:Carboxyl-terminal protease n=1 Tax=Fimbriiglobus ruber TaxID=1908690 RepID=A0A225DP81_9BACT|nr:S41 family peptidase [Fimbriiglobus ruber]OWK43280.1 Carboxyl-terminal protease [Fimbriiglobus ruber]